MNTKIFILLNIYIIIKIFIINCQDNSIESHTEDKQKEVYNGPVSTPGNTLFTNISIIKSSLDNHDNSQVAK